MTTISLDVADDSGHSVFSPSGASRWMACPASIRLSAGLEDTAGAAAVRGTEIHEQAAAMLLGLPEPFPEHKEYAQSYVDFVRGETSDGYSLFVEHRLPFTKWAPGGYGTADAVIVPDRSGWAAVIDMKTGQHQVDPRTPQLGIYALGVLQEWGDRAIEGVDVYIWQHGRVSSTQYTRDELLRFGEQVQRAARSALDPQSRPVPGDEQCSWCRARSICTARAVHLLGQAGDVYGVTTLGEILPVARRFDSWAQDVQERALRALVDGASIPGFKLVEGQSRRRWREDAADVLVDAGVPAEVIFERSLRSVTEIERALGKKAAAPVLARAAEKPAGKPTLAPADDPRPSLTPDF